MYSREMLCQSSQLKDLLWVLLRAVVTLSVLTTSYLRCDEEDVMASSV